MVLKNYTKVHNPSASHIKTYQLVECAELLQDDEEVVEIEVVRDRSQH